MHARAAAITLAFGVTACVGMPPDAFKLPPSSLEHRQLQSRRFVTTDDTLLLSSSIAVLQDLGYALDATNSHLGVLTASKEISATSTSQIVGSLLLAALTGAAAPIDKRQKVRVCLVITRSHAQVDASIARITIQRMVWSDHGLVTRVEAVTEPDLYRTFFERLAKATFLEANPT